MRSAKHKDNNRATSHNQLDDIGVSDAETERLQRKATVHVESTDLLDP